MIDMMVTGSGFDVEYSPGTTSLPLKIHKLEMDFFIYTVHDI